MKPFELCEYCRLLFAPADAPATCPLVNGQVDDPAEVERLSTLIPFTRWHTPKQLGQAFGYSKKHALRLAKEKGVAAIEIEGRWYVLWCSFAQLVPPRQK